MNLKDYIASLGTRVFAERLNFEVRTVESWRSGRRTPNRAASAKIVDNTPVTWEGIYRPGGEISERGARGLRPTLRGRKRIRH